jgi:hypothetical protein
MKIILPILILFLVTSCVEKCDCSYENYEKIKLRTNKKYVKKVLKMSPTGEVEVLDDNKKYELGVFDYNYVKLFETTYQCGENKITVYYGNGIVYNKSFN